MKENEYQRGLKKRLKQKFPGIIIFKTDASQVQGFPDLLLLYNNKWAALEVKQSETASLRPNQDWWVDTLNEMSFARIIFPRNETEVLNALEELFESSRTSCSV